MNQKKLQSASRRAPKAALAALSAACLFVLMTASALAAPSTVTDTFTGSASIPTGQASPVLVDPSTLTVRADGAIGVGYSYKATGYASGQLPGAFSYEEHGFLFFRNFADPTSMVGSQFSTGVFRLVSARGGDTITIVDTAPEHYSSGVQSGVRKLPPHAHSILGGRGAGTGALTYGYFTFTNPYGTFTGYATQDFANFAIQITFGAPQRAS